MPSRISEVGRTDGEASGHRECGPCSPKAAALSLFKALACAGLTLGALDCFCPPKPNDQWASALPQANTRVANLSGVMIHNAGTDIPRGDTLFPFSSQIHPTIDLLEELPILGAQFDPYQQGDDWVVRHVCADGSPGLLLQDELRDIHDWLLNNPDRLFVLDLDIGDRLPPGDSSLADVVLDELGHFMVKGTNPINQQHSQFGNTTVGDLLGSNIQVILSQRTQELKGFDDRVSLVFAPQSTRINNLNPLYNLGRGLSAVDSLACTDSSVDCTQLVNSGSLLELIQSHPSTQFVLDQLSRTTFETPKGLESEPTLGVVHTGSQTQQAIALALACSLATLAILNAGLRARVPNASASDSLLQANQLGQGFQTLGTLFPGLQFETSIAGLSTQILVLARELVSPEEDGHDAQQAPQSKATLPELLSTLNVMSQFASVAKYPISPVFQGLSALNVGTAGTGFGLHALNTLKAGQEGEVQHSGRKLMVDAVLLAIRTAGAGVAWPMLPGRFNAAALGLAASGSLLALYACAQEAHRGASRR